jgi:phosphatidylserine decarboxylase
MPAALDFSMSRFLFPHINPEGWKIVIPVLLVGLAAVAALWFFCRIPVWAGTGLSLFVLALSYAVALFFRDPERFPPPDPAALVSPADGTVCLIQQVPVPAELSPASADPVWRVSVFMSVLDVHVNRAPFDATLVRRVYIPGKFFNASLDKASKDNERMLWLARTPDGREFAFVQIAGLIARRIVPFAEEGDTLTRGTRFGLIRFGSRLDVYLPPGVTPAVALGQTMVAGETPLAHLPPSP